jgi:hypothetical protein
MSKSEITRRALVTGVAALAPTAAAALPSSLPLADVLAVAVPPDPIYTAIDRARKAEAFFYELDDRDDRLSAAGASANAACTALARTVPTTPDGLAALTSFVREAQARKHGGFAYFCEQDDFEAFAKSLDQAVRGMAGLNPWEGVPMLEAATDSIFIAIEAHRRARVAHEAAVDAFMEAESRVPKDFFGDAWTPIPQLVPGTDLLDLMPKDQQFVRKCYDADGIDEALATWPAESRAAAREMALKNLRSDRGKRARARRKCGYTQADRQVKAAWQVEDDALQLFVATVPTTAAGIEAALQYWLGLGYDGAWPQTTEFISSIRSAVRRLALGGPIPTPEGGAA